MASSSTALKTIRFGHSPDADDAFMFYGIANGMVDTQGLKIEHVVEDIESLNKRALQGELEVTAISVHAYAYVADRYAIMTSGASMGDNYSPILVSKDDFPLSDLKDKTVAVPGQYTSAYLALQLLNRDFAPVFIPFDHIIPAVQSGMVDAGLVIHEGQLTYRESKLKNLLDLGRWWFQKTSLPLPLGVDVVRKDLPADLQKKIARVFKDSIEVALKHRDAALAYALEWGRGMTQEQGDKFVGMYVNELTVDCGERGRKATELLLNSAADAKIIPHRVNLEFISPE